MEYVGSRIWGLGEVLIKKNTRSLGRIGGNEREGVLAIRWVEGFDCWGKLDWRGPGSRLYAYHAVW